MECCGRGGEQVEKTRSQVKLGYFFRGDAVGKAKNRAIKNLSVKKEKRSDPFESFQSRSYVLKKRLFKSE